MAIIAIERAVVIHCLLWGFILTGAVFFFFLTDDEELSNVWENEYLADDPTVPTSISTPT